MPKSSPKIVVVGSINMDLVARVARQPRPGETVEALDFARGPGGKGANQAVAAARLGASTSLIAAIGDDESGKELVEALAADGVESACIRLHRGCSSGLAMISVDENGENCICIVHGANALLLPSEIYAHEELIAAADALLLQLEIPLETVVAAAEVAKRHRVTTVLDPAPGPSCGLPASLYAVDLLTPNQTEAELLTGHGIETIYDAMAASKELHRRGAKRVVVTLGERGAVLCEEDVCTHVPVPSEAPAVDTTGAGDAFAAAVTVQLAAGADFHRATAYACAAGAVATMKQGAQAALPSTEEVDALIENPLKTH